MQTSREEFAMRQREREFALRYETLYRSAFRLTSDAVEADDLLQDCYVFFVSASTNTVIEDLDGYLQRMLENLLRSKRIREARHSMADLDHKTITPMAKVAPIAVARRSPVKPRGNTMLSRNEFNSVEKQWRWSQIVGDCYTQFWDVFWLPIGLISKLFWRLRLFQEQWAPWLFRSTFGRYPEKLNYTSCRDAACETCRSLQPGEIELDDEREITHDPFKLLSNLRD